eukprot:g3775.t1
MSLSMYQQHLHHNDPSNKDGMESTQSEPRCPRVPLLVETIFLQVGRTIGRWPFCLLILTFLCVRVHADKYSHLSHLDVEAQSCYDIVSERLVVTCTQNFWRITKENNLTVSPFADRDASSPFLTFSEIPASWCRGITKAQAKDLCDIGTKDRPVKTHSKSSDTNVISSLHDNENSEHVQVSDVNVVEKKRELFIPNSCDPGQRWDNGWLYNSCHDCEAGKYSPGEYEESCKECPSGKYSLKKSETCATLQNYYGVKTENGIKKMMDYATDKGNCVTKDRGVTCTGSWVNIMVMNNIQLTDKSALMDWSALILDGARVRVKGGTQSKTTLMGKGNDKNFRVFSIKKSEVELENLKISNGFILGAIQSLIDGDGGGLFIKQSSVTITNCEVSGNRLEWGFGGGIYVKESELTTTSCLIVSNSANRDKDIYDSSATLTMSQTTLQRPCVAGSYIKNDFTCVPCNGGKYQAKPQTSGPCYICPAGTYSEIGTGTSQTCTSCPKGRISNQGASECERCEAGKYINSEGGIECNLCEAGKYSDRDSAICSDCPPGSYSTVGQGKSSSCTKCPPGFFALNAGEGKGPREVFGEPGSNKCPVGSIAITKENCKYSNTRNDDQYPYGCIKIGGTTINWNFANGVGHSATQVICYQNTPCDACSAGRYSGQGSDKCNDCPVNTFSTGGHNSSGCTSCKENTFADVGAGTTPECEVCAHGRYANVSGFCNDCSPGTYSDTEAARTCKPCSRGYFGKDKGMTTPECSGQCPVGRYSEGGLSECIECPSGKLAPIGSTSVDKCQHLCQQGYWMNETNSNDCVPCPTGKYYDSVGITDPDQCKGCLPGTYNDNEGQAFCRSCPPAKFQSQANASACLKCVIGKIAPPQSSTCTFCELGQEPKPGQDGCQACEAGYYRSHYNNVSCLECPAGKFATKGSFTCQTCPPGRYGSAYLGDKLSNSCGGSCASGRYGLGGSLTNQCDGPCPKGSFSIGGASSKLCTLCPSGTFSNVTGSKGCLSCMKGTFTQNDGSTKCSNCPAGRFNNVSGSKVCEHECDPGTYGLGGSTSKECDAKCPPGSFSTKGASTKTCTLCQAGRYNNVYGASTCDNICERGKYSTHGASMCSQCPAGRVGWRRGAESESDCIDVFPGTFSDGKNITHGQVCPKGTYQDEPGQLTCKSCLPGRFGSKEGLQSSNCSGLCLPGFYSSIRASECQPCEAGKYNPNYGEEVCKTCSSEETSLKQATSCVCKESYYMNHNESCIPCMNGANCSSIGSTVYTLRLEKGYWRASNESINVFLCPMENTCEERIYHSQKSNETSVACAAGNTGVMCAICAKNYYRPSKSAACIKCGDEKLSGFFLFCGIIMSAVGLMLILYFNSKGGSGGIMRSAINFIQYMTVMLAFESEWPTFLKVLGQILKGLSFDFISSGYTSPQCLPYRKETYYFETVTMFFKLALWSSLVFFTQKSETQMATALVANTLNLVVLAYLKPYKGSLINLLQMGVLLITCGINFTGLILNYLTLSKNYNTHVTKSISKANSLLRQTNTTKLVIQIFSIALMSLLIGSLMHRNLPKLLLFLRRKSSLVQRNENIEHKKDLDGIELDTLNPLRHNTNPLRHAMKLTKSNHLSISINDHHSHKRDESRKI